MTKLQFKDVPLYDLYIKAVNHAVEFEELEQLLDECYQSEVEALEELEAISCNPSIHTDEQQLEIAKMVRVFGASLSHEKQAELLCELDNPTYIYYGLEGMRNRGVGMNDVNLVRMHHRKASQDVEVYKQERKQMLDLIINWIKRRYEDDAEAHRCKRYIAVYYDSFLAELEEITE